MPLELNSINKNPFIGQTLDPNGKFLLLWNRIFLFAALVALFIDPLYFYVPYIAGHGCFSIHKGMYITFTTLRSFTDMFYLFHVVLKFRTAYILPGSTVIGKGELVMDSRKIVTRYLKSDFIVDLTALIPLPQIVYSVVWILIPPVANETAEHSNRGIGLFILIQYVPRFYIIFPLHQQIIGNSGVVTKTAWGGAVYNLFLYMLASHVFGASWYLLSIQRQYDCWSMECNKDLFKYKPCKNKFFDCRSLNHKDRVLWLNNTSVFLTCDAKGQGKFKYGIFTDALVSKVLSTKFLEKYLYCLWWGLNNISSFGQNLSSSGYIPEAAFCMFICIVGVLLFCHLIANIQTYLQSMTTRFEVWREQTKVTDNWMKQRGLPSELQERIHKYLQYKWSATNGVDEASIMQSLPLDLRRNVRRHVCLDLVHRVHFFSHMDTPLQDAICERLVPSLIIAGAFIIRESDPVEEILFVLRGKLESSTTGGGYGFRNSFVLVPGDYCGEELLTWTLKPNPSQVLPSSPRTVQALTDIDAFALQAADLKYVANLFKRLHSKKLIRIFRFHSEQWRIWAASYIQAAWRRFKKKKVLEELLAHVRLDGEMKNNQHARFPNLATTCRAIFHVLGSWRRVQKRKHSQILEMCESFYYLQNKDEAMDFDNAECSSMDRPMIEMERLEEAGEIMDRSTGGESSSMEEHSNNGIQLGALALASLFCEKLTGVHRKIGFIDPEDSMLEMLTLRKPRDPDFSKHIDSG